MNLILKTALTSLIFSVSLHSVHAMQEITVVKMAIQADIEHFERAARFSTGSDRTAQATIAGIKYKLMAMQMPNWKPVFTFECSNKELENYFKEKLGV